jgi:uncharacterized protein YbjQ (UPF0145 family)
MGTGHVFTVDSCPGREIRLAFGTLCAKGDSPDAALDSLWAAASSDGAHAVIGVRIASLPMTGGGGDYGGGVATYIEYLAYGTPVTLE